MIRGLPTCPPFDGLFDQYNPRGRERKFMRKYRCLWLLQLLMAADAGAFSIFPTLGYSSSSGFVLGGTAARSVMSPESLLVGMYTLGAYYGTSGMVSVSGGAVLASPPWGRQYSAGYERLLHRSWYGWGNGTHPDTTAGMHLERQSISLNLRRAFAPGVLLQAGLLARHSSVYEREDSFLWDEAPTDRYGSTWTMGPEAGVTLTSGSGSRVSARMTVSLQTGDVSYGSINCGLSSRTRLPGGLELGTSVNANRHFGTGSTPIPFVPSLGQSQGFRGYSDYRFTGPVWLLCSAELSRMLVQLEFPVFDRPWRGGVAVFADAGQVAESFSGLGMNRFHSDVGAGLRLLTHDDLLLKLDCAWGDENILVSAGIENPF